jgi:hypothetical protein
MKQTFLKAYESPKAEVIEIESQGMLCASGGETSPGFSTTGGLQFGNGGNGDWL